MRLDLDNLRRRRGGFGLERPGGGFNDRVRLVDVERQGLAPAAGEPARAVDVGDLPLAHRARVLVEDNLGHLHRRAEAPTAVQVSAVLGDEFVRTRSQARHRGHRGAPGEGVAAGGDERVPRRGTRGGIHVGFVPESPGHVARRGAVAVGGGADGHRREDAALGPHAVSVDGRLRPDVEPRASVEAVGLAAVGGVKEGSADALVFEKLDLVILGVRIVVGAAELRARGARAGRGEPVAAEGGSAGPVGPRAEGDEVEVLLVDHGDVEAVEGGAARGVARGDEDVALIAGKAHALDDRHGTLRGGGTNEGAEVVLHSSRDGVVVDGANVEARVRRLTSAVLREIHHQFHHGAVVAVGDRGDVVVGARGRHARGGARAGANARGKIGAELGGDVEGRLRARHRAGRGHRKHRNGRDEAAGCAAGIRALLSSRHSPWPVPSADTIAHPRKDPSSIGYRCTDATYWRVRLCPPGARGGRRKGNCRVGSAAPL